MSSSTLRHLDPLASVQIERVPFRHPSIPGLLIETMTLANNRQRLPPRAFVSPERVEFHQLIMVFEGKGKHFLDFEDIDCRPGTVLFLRPGGLQQFRPRAAFEGWTVLVDPQFLLPAAVAAQRDLELSRVDAPLDALALPGHLQLDAATTRLLRRHVELLAAEHDRYDGSADASVLLRNLFYALMLRLGLASRTQLVRRGTSLPQARWFEAFRLQVEQDFHRTRRVEDYARKLRCSVKTLARTCEAAAATSPKAYIDQRIALEAKRLLVHTPLQVAQIAEYLGFDEPGNFVKFFRRITSGTPRRFGAERQAKSSADSA